MKAIKEKAMSNETDLDWLARNVHVWPENDIIEIATTEIPSKLAFDGVAFSLKPSGLISRHAVYVTKDQWLARRAELQNKPSWETHEYKVIAQGRNGSWYGSNYSEEKFGHESSFCIMGTGWNCICRGVDLGDWRDTLEKRPEGSMVSMSGVHSNGDMEKLLDELNDIDESIFGDGFIPKDAATAKQQAPKGSGNPILGMVLADLTNRALEGKEKYGEPLRAHNERNPLWDAYQEALDLAMYLRQAIEELG